MRYSLIYGRKKITQRTLAGAVNYPYDDISRGKRYLPKGRKLILYCEHGGGSMQMARMLGQEGYQVATVVGGYEAMKKFRKTISKIVGMCNNRKD